jgi:hypothetical protein
MRVTAQPEDRSQAVLMTQIEVLYQLGCRQKEALATPRPRRLLRPTRRLRSHSMGRGGQRTGLGPDG